MPTPLILQKQKADIVKVLEEAGLPATDFSWTDDASNYLHDSVASTISYKPGEYYFRIDRNANGYWVVKYCPSDKKWIYGPDRTGAWERILGAAKDWVGYVMGELDAESYLTIAMNSPKLLQLPGPEDENTPFSEIEQQQLIDCLDKIEGQLLSLREDNDEFRAEVAANFDCLRDEVERGGRTAFRYALFGAILAIGLAFLTPDETKQIIDFATRQINAAGQLVTHSPSD